jgi:hypothetical protein
MEVISSYYDSVLYNTVFTLQQIPFADRGAVCLGTHLGSTQ